MLLKSGKSNPSERTSFLNDAPAPLADVPKLNPAEFDEIRGLAKRRFGLDLRHGKEELVSARLSKTMRQGKFRSFRDYIASVERDQSGQQLINLINALTTNHTSFYREPHHFEYLSSEILPHFRPGSDLRIWCAASSTGEEPYTILCTVAQAWKGQVRGLRLLATDISTKVLDIARAGVYKTMSLDPAPPNWKHDYFVRTPEDGGLRIRRELASQVEFRRLNLIEPFPFQEKFHLIFCRNVMIYFDKPTQENLVQRLAAHLEPGGHLFVGHSESLAGVNHPLDYLRPAVYRVNSGKRGLIK